jgi:hypothetical protein
MSIVYTRRKFLFAALLAPLSYFAIIEYQKNRLTNKYSTNIIAKNYTNFQAILDIYSIYGRDGRDDRVRMGNISFFKGLEDQYKNNIISKLRVKFLINERIKKDFSEENIVFISGWMLSQTECDLTLFILDAYDS